MNGTFARVAERGDIIELSTSCGAEFILLRLEDYKELEVALDNLKYLQKEVTQLKEEIRFIKNAITYNK